MELILFFYCSKQDRGAEIKSISYITREEPFPYLYENADFSINTIKDSIKEGELKADKILKGLALDKQEG